jgi:hypothetical protein
MQVRLSAFTKRDDEASKTGGQPFSHRAFGEVVAQKLQVCPPRCLVLSGNSMGAHPLPTHFFRPMHAKPHREDCGFHAVDILMSSHVQPIGCACGAQDTSKKGELIRVDAEHLEGVATD